jgi:delta 1-pyrroline-5-carboxylate dehydrogenase
MSFPKAWNSSVHDALNVDPVLEAPAPEPSAAYKSVVRNGAVEDGKGNWVYAWKEQEMFTEYTDDNGDVQTVAAQKTAYDMANTAALAATERAKRTALLMETDHYALADVTMPDAMKTYRQALRDVPQQTDFPSKIDWPTKP